MKILHVSAGNLTSGAAKGAFYLHSALIQSNIDSRILINYKNEKESETNLYSSDIFNMQYSRRITELDKLSAKLYRNRKHGPFHTGFVGTNIIQHPWYRDADIIHLHWINNFISIKEISRIDKPIVWTLRDMWPLTGGCHYSLDCKRYKIGCGKCPALIVGGTFDASYFSFREKCKTYPKNISFVGVSEWISEFAAESQILGNRSISTIHNGIDTNLFYPVSKTIARNKLGLPLKKKIVLFGAQRVDDPLKGSHYLTSALANLNDPNVLLLTFGYLDSKIRNLFNKKSHHLGFIDDPEQLKYVYSAADLFVHSSSTEAFGKTIVESMACGIPVVCFDHQGAKDIVSHLITGYKAEPFDDVSLAQGIRYFLEISQAEYLNYSKQSRERAVKLFDFKVMAHKYVSLYNKILSN